MAQGKVGMILRSTLPATILSKKPFVFAAFDMDFLNRLPTFGSVLRNYESPTLLMQLGWQREKIAAAKELADKISHAVATIPGFRVIVLTNSPLERDNLIECGAEAVYCHHNAFLDERRYPILSSVNKRFDAIYIARITPFKRHYLAGDIKSLRLIGEYRTSESDYAKRILATLNPIKWTRRYKSFLISFPINQARCGLALSAEEGGMFVCAEYLLCGLPVVTTRNIGGRNEFIPPAAMHLVEDSPSAVAQAVCELSAKPLNYHFARQIRAGVMEKMFEHRSLLLNLLNDLGATEAATRYRKHFPHKLGLRQGRLTEICKMFKDYSFPG